MIWAYPKCDSTFPSKSQSECPSVCPVLFRFQHLVSRLHPKYKVTQAYPNSTKDERSVEIVVLDQGSRPIRRESKLVVVSVRTGLPVGVGIGSLPVTPNRSGEISVLCVESDLAGLPQHNKT